MNEYSKYILQVKCPECFAGAGHWCRDGEGKCVPPHPSRRKEALKAACGVLAPRKTA